MASRTIESFISVANVSDGAAGITITLSNENHTFSAGAMGAVAADVISQFICDINVLFGTTEYAVQTNSNALAASRWRVENSGGTVGAGAITISSPGSANSRINASLAARGSNTYRLTVAEGTGSPTFFDDGGPDQATLTIPIRVNHAGTIVQFNKTVTLSKAKGGSATVLTLEVSENVIPYGENQALATPTNQIEMTATLQNFEGSTNVTWEYRSDQSNSWAALPTQNFTRSGSRQTTVTTTHQNVVALMSGSARAVSIRATLAGVFDVISIHRVYDGRNGNDGENGVDAVEHRLEPRSSTILRNSDSSQSVTIDSNIYFQGTQANDAVTSRQWFLREGGSNTNVSGQTGSSFTIAANHSNLQDGGTLVGCRLVYDDEHADVTP